MLLLENKDIAEILTMEACLEALEESARAMASGDAVARPATSVVMQKAHERGAAAYKLESRDGIARHKKMAAMRIMSDTFIFPKLPDGSTKKIKTPGAPGNRYVGLVLLFDTDTGELAAILPDAEIQRRRVAGTGALASKYVARKDAQTLTIIGSSWQAEMAAIGHCLVYPLSQIRVFSPNQEHRQAFCDRMADQVPCQVVPADSVAEAMKGSDLVVAVTNGPGATVTGELLERGMHVNLVRYFELDEPGWKRCDVIIEGDRPERGDPSFWTKQVFDHRWVMGGRDKAPGTDFSVSGSELYQTRARHVPLPDVVTGQQAGRQRAEIKGVLIVEMVKGGKELIIGSKLEPGFGPVIMLGMGGIYVEVLKDVTFKIAPVTEREADDMIASIKTQKILQGVRGEKPSDISKLSECIQRLSQLVTDFKEIKELDMNPVLVMEKGKGCRILDVRIGL